MSPVLCDSGDDDVGYDDYVIMMMGLTMNLVMLCDLSLGASCVVETVMGNALPQGNTSL